MPLGFNGKFDFGEFIIKANMQAPWYCLQIISQLQRRFFVSSTFFCDLYATFLVLRDGSKWS